MAHGAPIAGGRADFDSDAKGLWGPGSLGLPPESGLTPGGFQGVVEVVEYRMGGSVLVDQAVGTDYGAVGPDRKNMGAGGHGKGHNFLAEGPHPRPCDRFKLSRERQETVIAAPQAGAPHAPACWPGAWGAAEGGNGLSLLPGQGPVPIGAEDGFEVGH